MSMEKFHYKLPTVRTETVSDDGGNTSEVETEYKHNITLPKFENLPFGLIRKTRKLPEADQFFSILETLLTESELEALDRAGQKSVVNMLTEWKKDSDVSLGES